MLSPTFAFLHRHTHTFALLSSVFRFVSIREREKNANTQLTNALPNKHERRNSKNKTTKQWTCNWNDERGFLFPVFFRCYSLFFRQQWCKIFKSILKSCDLILLCSIQRENGNKHVKETQPRRYLNGKKEHRGWYSRKIKEWHSRFFLVFTLFIIKIRPWPKLKAKMYTLRKLQASLAMNNSEWCEHNCEILIIKCLDNGIECNEYV